MVNDEVVLKKKKKLKKKLAEVGDVDDPTPKKKKKSKHNLDDSVKKKKKKKKKLLKNSTLLLNESQIPEEGAEDNEAAPEEANSDDELFGSSQSPIKSSGAAMLSSPPPLKHAPLNHHHSNGTEEDSGEEMTPVKKSPKKRSPEKPTRPSPVISFKKKEKMADPVIDSDSDAVSDDEIHSLPASGEVIPDIPSSYDAAIPSSAPLSDPLISQHEQDQRDLILLEQVSEKFPDNSQTAQINWTEIYCFSMSPDEMAARFEVLLKNIPREKNFRTLVNEAKIAFCNAKIREVPLTKRDRFAGVGILGDPTRKRVNAFSLFTRQFDPRLHARAEIKSKWDVLDPTVKKKLMREARALNNVNRIHRGEPKAKKPMSGYTMFTKEQMNKGLKMVDIGVRWQGMSQDEKDEYKAKATEANRERTESNEPSSQP